MKKKKKLNLDQLKLQSFVTEPIGKKYIWGGAGTTEEENCASEVPACGYSMMCSPQEAVCS